MRIAVIGAGVVGISTAHALVSDGHEVTLHDAAVDAATAATAATAGLIAPGHSYAWASPGAPGMLLRSLGGARTSIRVRPRFDLELIRWGLSFLRECRPSRFAANTRAKYTLARYSQELLAELTRDEDLDYAGTDGGVLYLHRDPEGLERAAKQAELLSGLGRRQQVLDAREVLRIEPGLDAGSVAFAGAIFDPEDRTGDPRRFAAQLLRRALARGVEFVPSSTVHRLVVEDGRVRRAETSRGPLHAEAFVLAAGSLSSAVAATAGVRLPIYPAKGYSVSVPWRPGAEQVGTGGIDERTLVAWSPFDGALRMSATAEFGGYDTTHRPPDFALIRAAADELFPGRLDWAKVEHHTGLRPMTPDGPPFVGATHVPNLFTNAGHGHLGWTMATGSARLIRDLVAGRRTGIDARPYSPLRLRSRARLRRSPGRAKRTP